MVARERVGSIRGDTASYADGLVNREAFLRKTSKRLQRFGGLTCKQLTPPQGC